MIRRASWVLVMCAAVVTGVVAGREATGLAAGQAAGAEEIRGDEDGRPDRFGRMFHLPAFARATPAVRAALVELGRRGGLLDARDDLAAGAVALIVDPALSANNPNNDRSTAGVTFVGQFLDHDMTFDTASRLGRPTSPRRSPNARRPFLDLDSVYGAGPVGSPQLYDPADRAKFRVESGGRHEDLPRDASGQAIVADPRNDENLVIAGLHAALLLFHNQVVDHLRQDQPELEPEDVFAEAQRLVTWHYQWLVLHEFLPKVAGQATVDELLTGGRSFYRPRRGDAFMPVEFQIAYRMGHSMVRPSYRANFTGDAGAPFFALIFDPSQGEAADPADLRGGRRAERRFIGWTTFFHFPGFEDDVRPNKRIDSRVSSPLFDLPLGAIPTGAPPTSLAARNLLRHLTWSVPSGQAIAAALGVPALSPTQLAELGAVYPPFAVSTPLWYYVLKEAEVFEQGVRLGPVGSRIVAEVFVGLMRSDPDSYLNERREFVPVLGAVPGEFGVVDLLTFAGVGGRR
jgi:hypothetical protein